MNSVKDRRFLLIIAIFSLLALLCIKSAIVISQNLSESLPECRDRTSPKYNILTDFRSTQSFKGDSGSSRGRGSQEFRSMLEFLYSDAIDYDAKVSYLKEKGIKLGISSKSALIKSRPERLIMLPCQNLTDAEDTLLNYIPTNWIIDVIESAHLIILILDDEGGDSRRPSSLQNLIEDLVRERIPRGSDHLTRLQQRIQIIGMKSKAVDGEFPQGTDRQAQIAGREAGAGIRILSGMVAAGLLLSQQENNPGKDQGKDSSDVVVSIITKNIYVDPDHFIQLMDDIVEESSYSHSRKGLTTIGNECVIGSIREIRRFSSGFLESLHAAKSLSCRRCPFESSLTECFESISDLQWSSMTEFRSMQDRNHAAIDNHPINFGSCQLPEHAFGFHEISLESFKFCSFVHGIRNEYEPHAIRLLQRLSRGRPYEVNWMINQTSDIEKKRKCNIAIGLTSRPGRVDERMGVRRNWGLIARSLGMVKMFFVYGTPENGFTEKEKQEIEKENKEFKDIVVLPLKEGYFQIFKKVTAWLGWAYDNTNCDVVMKVDPDTFLRMFPLFKFLIKRSIVPLSKAMLPGDPNSGVQFGVWIDKARTLQEEPNHRWYFYDVWPHEIIPPFMSGSANGMSRTLAKYVYDRRIPDKRLDDPGIGVILHGLTINSNRLRFEIGPEWDAGTTRNGECVKDKIHDNGFYSPGMNMTKNFLADIYQGNFCELIRNITVDPLIDLPIKKPVTIPSLWVIGLAGGVMFFVIKFRFIRSIVQIVIGRCHWCQPAKRLVV